MLSINGTEAHQLLPELKVQMWLLFRLIVLTRLFLLPNLTNASGSKSNSAYNSWQLQKTLPVTKCQQLFFFFSKFIKVRITQQLFLSSVPLHLLHQGLPTFNFMPRDHSTWNSVFLPPSLQTSLLSSKRRISGIRQSALPQQTMLISPTD